jgi:hypothetical protein
LRVGARLADLKVGLYQPGLQPIEMRLVVGTTDHHRPPTAGYFKIAAKKSTARWSLDCPR